jgi:Cdc6-like AAA superfamily ATPase
MSKTLSPVFSASFDSLDLPAGCMSETRTDVICALEHWRDGTRMNLSIFWLLGMAGTGKTMIAKTFCERLSKNGVLASSFFVSRQSTLRKNPYNIIRTIAYDFTQLHPFVLEAMYQTTRERPEISACPMEEQIALLIVEPLAKYQTTSSAVEKAVIVIDALDYCDSIVDTSRFLSLLTSQLASYPIKLLITSRNEKHIHLAFEVISHDSLKLHDLDY